MTDDPAREDFDRLLRGFLGEARPNEQRENHSPKNPNDAGARMVDPFGLRAGSTPPSGMADYIVSFHSVPKPHPALVSYLGHWSPDHGLTRITASSKTFEDESDCSSARELYDRLKRQLTQLYGSPEELEHVDEDGVWPEEDDFWNAVKEGERTHMCRWSSGDGHQLDEKVDRITLMVCAEDAYDASQVSLSYTFSGHERGQPSDEYGLESL